MDRQKFFFGNLTTFAVFLLIMYLLLRDFEYFQRVDSVRMIVSSVALLVAILRIFMGIYDHHIVVYKTPTKVSFLVFGYLFAALALGVAVHGLGHSMPYWLLLLAYIPMLIDFFVIFPLYYYPIDEYHVVLDGLMRGGKFWLFPWKRWNKSLIIPKKHSRNFLDKPTVQSWVDFDISSKSLFMRRVLKDDVFEKADKIYGLVKALDTWAIKNLKLLQEASVSDEPMEIHLDGYSFLHIRWTVRKEYLLVGAG